jgi:hypothetical protein
MKDSLKYSTVIQTMEDLKNERMEWESEWRQISEYLLPGRGIYQTFSKPRKRKLVSPKVINTTGEDALYILTSGMHGGLTSPSRPWFKLLWAQQDLNKFEPLKAWIQECELRLHSRLQDSNFYSIINSFYNEYAGFGSSCIYVGDNTDSPVDPFHFELLTAGEYYISLDASGKPLVFCRIIYLTPAQMVARFSSCSASIKKDVKEGKAGIHLSTCVVVEYITKEKFSDKTYTQIFYEYTDQARTRREGEPEPLEIKGFYEWPYPFGRWSTVGSDVYGIGPGSRALPHIKRLQEMEKAFLMATHKSINPPLNAPARMKGKLNTLPGGYNYYSNPSEKVDELYQIRFDYTGVSSAIERVEERIQKNFFNDIFLTGTRDPNATPYKATEVTAREQEKMLRLGPVIERLQNEFLKPLIERCFNIMLRRGLFPPMDPALAQMAGDYSISLVSPLATAQRAVALNGINSFLAFLSQAAQFSPEIIDNVNPDEAARDYADITGVRLGILRQTSEVQQLRAQRQQQMQAEKEKQDQMMAAQVAGQYSGDMASARKAQADAGKSMAESQQIASEMGMM